MPTVPLVQPRPARESPAADLIVVHTPAGPNRPIQTLPLVDLTGMTQPSPAPTTPTRTPARRPEPTSQPQQPNRHNDPPLDIAQIVDTVHRKFLRRLAVEAERRAVR